MKRENPRDASSDELLCVWCGGKIAQSGVGRRKEYCSRTHREYAYRARREADMKLRAYSKGRADERTVSSTDGMRTDPLPSVDETKVAAQRPAPAAPSEPSRSWTWTGMHMLPIPLDDPPDGEPGGPPRRDPRG